MNLKIRSSCLTDIGKKKENNEDACSISRWVRDGKGLLLDTEGCREGEMFRGTPVKAVFDSGVLEIEREGFVEAMSSGVDEEILENALMAMVCDGIGGYEGGEVASALVAENLPVALWKTLLSCDDVRRCMKETVLEFNGREHTAVKGKPLEGMGTTMVSLLLYGESAYFINAGDSRGYLFRDGFLERITIDHSLVQEMVDSGEIDEEDAFGHPKSNILRSGLVRFEDPAVGVFRTSVEKGDIFLLCSDGLSDLVKDDEIERIINDSSFDLLARKLVDAALRRGGKDNITVVLVLVDGLEE